jgi:hypothetical protein
VRITGSRTVRNSWRGLLLVGVGLSGGVALQPPGAGAGSQPQAYVALASAAGARISWVVPGQFAVEEVVDGGGPVAQSRLDAGSSESFASLPYPGGTAVAYQGLFSVATGISSPFAYPFYVQATNPGAPEAEVADPSGTYRLQAKAAGPSTTAGARFRPGAPEAIISGGEATTGIAIEGPTVVSSAESLAEAISLAGGTLQIGSVRSRSVTTYTDGAGTPETKTSLMVDGLSAGGTRFGVGPDGFVVLGQPVPSAPKEAQAVLEQILGPAGLSLRFVQAQALPGGGQAAALEIVARQTQPQFPSSTVSLRLGGASSTVSLGEGPLPAPVVDVPGTETVTPPSTVGGPAAGGAAGVSDPSPAATATFPGSSAPQSSAGFFGAGTPAVGTDVASSGPDPVGVSSGSLGDGVASVGSVPGSGSAPPPATTELAAQPIVRPREVGAARLIYGLVGAGAALMLLLGGAITKRGRTAWLDA